MGTPNLTTSTLLIVAVASCQGEVPDPTLTPTTTPATPTLEPPTPRQPPEKPYPGCLAWFVGEMPYALFGFDLAVGDLNGDGVSDLSLGAPDESSEELPDSGVVYVQYGPLEGGRYASEMDARIVGRSLDKIGENIVLTDLGSNHGDDLIFSTWDVYDYPDYIYIFSSPPQGSISASTAETIIASDDTSSIWVGGTLHGASDVNGDGSPDLLIEGGGNFDGVYSQLVMGFYGGMDLPKILRPDEADLILKEDEFPPYNFTYFGEGIAAGDIDDDGFVDVIVGAPLAGDMREGKVVTFKGPLPDITYASDAWSTLLGQEGETCGCTPPWGCTVCGDEAGTKIVYGFDKGERPGPKVLITAPGKGGESGLSETYLYTSLPEGTQPITSTPFRFTDTDDFQLYDEAWMEGDSNGDGSLDIVLEARWMHPSDGGGPAIVTLICFNPTLMAAGRYLEACRVVWDMTRTFNTREIGSVRDLNGDGLDELLLTDWGYTNSTGYVGAACVVPGSAQVGPDP